jgi:NADPH-dependent 2,4-dienoyl-CoA reductase/sulfur reductase-like enzyme
MTKESAYISRLGFRSFFIHLSFVIVLGLTAATSTALAEKRNVPGIFAAGDIARWPDLRAGRIRVEHWVVAQRQGQTAARNILGAQEPFKLPPFFWSNHFDLHIHYVGHGAGNDRSTVSGNLKAKDASVIYRDGDKLTAVASIGRDVENLEAELALERGEEFSSS